MLFPIPTLLVIVMGISLGLFPGEALAQAAEAAPPPPDTGDTAFMLLCAALVLLMTPGLAFFYGGFVRSLNILNTLMMSFVLMLVVGVTWILWGYSLAFAPGTSFIGGLEWLFLNGVGLETTGYLPHMGYEDALKAANPNYADLASYAGTIPHQAFMIYSSLHNGLSQ